MGEGGWLVEVAAENAALRAENALDREARERAVRDIASLRAELAAAKEEVERLREQGKVLVAANTRHFDEARAAKEENERLRGQWEWEAGNRGECLIEIERLRTQLAAEVVAHTKVLAGLEVNARNVTAILDAMDVEPDTKTEEDGAYDILEAIRSLCGLETK